MYIQVVSLFLLCHRLGVLLFILGKISRGTALQAGMSRVLFSMGLLEFFVFFNPSGRDMALRSNSRLTDLTTRGLS